MQLEEIMQMDNTYYMNTFGKRIPVCFERGSGIHLYDTKGEEYTDFFSGIAVTALGHSHPKFVASLTKQAQKLLHTSSLYYIEAQARLAALLVSHSCADRAFLCSTGAEANEGAMKLAKIHFYKKGQPEKYEIISLKNSFHGRTLATVAATGQEKYQKPYQPLTPGFKSVQINDFAALEQAVNPHTAAILLEVIQGESGVHPVGLDYVKKVRALCDQKELLLIVDEVQTGMGRTGSWFAYQQFGIEPDIFTLAKALGNGIPIGAVCAKEFVASSFSPGDHGTTFGGNPFSSNAGCTVFEIMEEERLVENSAKVGAYFKNQLSRLTKEYPEQFCEVRGLGLMLGLETVPEVAGRLQRLLFEKHYLVGNVGGKVLRILPPLILKNNDVDEFVQVLRECIAVL